MKRYAIQIIVLLFVAALVTIGAFAWEPMATVVERLEVELGDPLPPAEAFVEESAKKAHYDPQKPLPAVDQVGTTPVEILIGRYRYASELAVVDTTPPAATSVDQTLWIGETLEPEAFVEDIADHSPVTVAFHRPPDFETPGLQSVALSLVDSAGNQTRLTAALEVYEDREPPVIEGVADQEVFVGQTVQYRRDVRVMDNRTKRPDLAIDTDGVNLQKPGRYPVVYTATDEAGNQTQVTATLTVAIPPPKIVTEAEVAALAAGVADRILTEGMTDLERLEAIFWWVRKNIVYVGYSDKSSWLYGAYQGFRSGKGDCFNYYATARALLDHAGFTYVPVRRTAGTPTRHYWLLVSYGGQWYHFDANPAVLGFTWAGFMKSDPEVADYTERVKNVIPSYYIYDKEDYPPAATEPLAP